MPGSGAATLTAPGLKRREPSWVIGIQLALAAYLLFSCQDATIKYLLSSFSIWQILFVRSVVIFVASLVAGGPKLVVQAYRSPVRWALGARALTSLTAWWCFFAAAKTLAMGQLTALYLVAPILATVISTYSLNEGVGIWTWVALGLGAIGTLVAAGSLDVGSLNAAALVLAGAVIWAITVVLMRWVGQRESVLVQVASNNMLFLVVTMVMSLGEWRTSSSNQIVLMAAVGLLSGVAQWLLVASAKRIPVSVMSVVQYTALPWSFMFGFLVWGSCPDAHVVVGSAMICIGGVCVLFGEKWQRRHGAGLANLVWRRAEAD